MMFDLDLDVKVKLFQAFIFAYLAVLSISQFFKDLYFCVSSLYDHLSKFDLDDLDPKVNFGGTISFGGPLVLHFRGVLINF